LEGEESRGQRILSGGVLVGGGAPARFERLWSEIDIWLNTAICP
jgi:hypothetical protein